MCRNTMSVTFWCKIAQARHVHDGEKIYETISQVFAFTSFIRRRSTKMNILLHDKRFDVKHEHTTTVKKK
jgi:hypothetical protein